jgi:hypothetical protein
LKKTFFLFTFARVARNQPKLHFIINNKHAKAFQLPSHRDTEVERQSSCYGMTQEKATTMKFDVGGQKRKK